MLKLIATSALVTLVALAIWFDLTQRRIPNWISASGFAVGLILSAVAGAEALSQAVATTAATLVVSVLLFAAGGFGGGDVKFLVAVSAFMAPTQLLETVVYASAAGALLALVVSVKRGTLLPLFLDSGQLAIHLVTLGRRGERRVLETADSAYAAIPYGVAIGIGVLAAWFT